MPPPTLPSAIAPPCAVSSACATSLGFHVKAVDVVQPAIPCLGDHRQAPPIAGLVSRAVRESPGDDRIARDADAVRVCDNDRSFEKPALLHPGRAGHLAISVQAEVAGVNRIVQRLMAARHDRGHAGAHRAFADFEFSLAADQGGVADLHARDIGDRIELSGCAVESNAEIARADRFFPAAVIAVRERAATRAGRAGREMRQKFSYVGTGLAGFSSMERKLFHSLTTAGLERFRISLRITFRPKMKASICALLLLMPTAAIGDGASIQFDAAAAERFARLALACVEKEYPNKISHVLNSDADVAPPRKFTPAFYGCYDWHSSVHGHWLLVRLVRKFPDAPFVAPAREALRKSLSSGNLKQEAAYLREKGRASFERPYGLAWLLQLCVELREWDDPQAKELSLNLRPLEDAAIERLRTWLPKLSYPVRIGEHDQTAFALGLMLDYARCTGNEAFAKLLTDQARKFYLADKNCPLRYEPSGEDFLSPCLGEADVMRRVLPPAEFATWLQGFMPQIPTATNSDWLPVTVSPDPSDPKLAHLDGLNLSRAWMLEGIISALPADDPRRPALAAAAEAHRRAGLAAVTGAHYEGGHWLGSFAVYLVTQRGLQRDKAK